MLRLCVEKDFVEHNYFAAIIKDWYEDHDKLLNFIITTENVFPPNKRPGNSFSADNL